ncbi:MAG: hypothetical protein PHE53_13145 [Thermoguttaceae bacterium]|nr:hypothetical protein [Thermoguttaceae bacterium]
MSVSVLAGTGKNPALRGGKRLQMACVAEGIWQLEHSVHALFCNVHADASMVRNGV